jgi:two-component system LytT family sensor kinase
MLPARARTWLLISGFWTLFGIIAGTQIQISMLSHHHSWLRVLFYQVVVWDLWILFSLVVIGLVRRVPLVPARAGAILFHLAVGLLIGIVHAAQWVALVLLIRPYDFMNPTAFMGTFEWIAVSQMPLELVLYGLVALAVHVREAHANARERELRAAQLERSLAEARLHALELQIQPHFLFNTLNAIGALVRGGQNAQAVGMITGLSDLLRYALDRAGGARVALAEEAGMLARYLEIQRLRFPDRLTCTIDVAEGARRAAVPVLLLQPLAENAIRHGIAKSEAPGRVTMRAFREGESLRVEMFNTGRLDPEPGRGIGLSITIARLEELYGERQSFALRQEDGGVLAALSIPWSPVS